MRTYGFKNFTENFWCAPSALLFHLNDYSTQINYFNVCILNGELIFILVEMKGIKKARIPIHGVRIVDLEPVRMRDENRSEMQWQKTKGTWTPHSFALEKWNVKLTSGWKKEGIERIKCLIYDEVAQTRIKYLHIPIIHPTREWTEIADSAVFSFALLRICMTVMCDVLCVTCYVSIASTCYHFNLKVCEMRIKAVIIFLFLCLLSKFTNSIQLDCILFQSFASY